MEPFRLHGDEQSRWKSWIHARNVITASARIWTLANSQFIRSSAKVSSTPIQRLSQKMRIAQRIIEVTATVGYQTLGRRVNRRFINFKDADGSEKKICGLSTTWISTSRKRQTSGYICSLISCPITTMYAPKASPVGPKVFCSKWTCRRSIPRMQPSSSDFFRPLNLSVIRVAQ